MEINGWIHVIGVTNGLILGAVVILVPKLTKLHRVLGLGYLVSMVAVNVSALTIFRETGSVGPFHILAVVSLVTLGLGYNEVVRKRKTKGWLERHGIYMAFSYVGLVAAGASQFASNYLPVAPLVGNLGASVLVFVIGGILTMTLVPRTVRGQSGGASRTATSDGLRS